MKSNCCNAPLITEQSDEGTGFYRCEKCGNACDPNYVSHDKQAISPLERETKVKIIKLKPSEMILTGPSYYFSGNGKLIGIVPSHLEPKHELKRRVGKLIKLDKQKP